jgi:hypothetical protein
VLAGKALELSQITSKESGGYVNYNLGFPNEARPELNK